LDDLIDLEAVIRRVITARVNDAHLVEDLTQETLVHVAAADPKLGAGARRGYAIVTARHLVISHARGQAIHDRHAHRLVDYTNLDGPEELTLEREETEALTEALQRLEPVDRQLLIRHEAGGAALDTLAREAGTSTGAVAMRLARARAQLRVEFVLAFRRVRLPTRQCRPVLIALSAGDRRSQDRVKAAQHLVRCPTCASLAQPLTERRRGIALWLLLPVAEAARRALGLFRRSHLVQAATVAAIAAAATVAVVAARDGSSPPTAAPSATPTLRPQPLAAAPQPTTTPPPTTTACPPPAPLNAASVLGCPIGDTVVVAVEVPADEGFWGQTSDGQTIWVHLVGDGESPVEIVPGTALTISGTVAPADPGDPITTDPRVEATGRILETPYDAVRPG